MSRPQMSHEEHSQSAKKQMVTLVQTAGDKGVTWGKLTAIMRAHGISVKGMGLLVYNAGIVKGKDDRYRLKPQITEVPETPPTIPPKVLQYGRAVLTPGMDAVISYGPPDAEEKSRIKFGRVVEIVVTYLKPSRK